MKGSNRICMFAYSDCMFMFCARVPTIFVSQHAFYYFLLPCLVLENMEYLTSHNDVILASALCLCCSLSQLSREMVRYWENLF